MSQVAIRSLGLGKLYRIGARERYKTLSGRLTRAIQAPFRQLRLRTGGGDTNGSPDGTMWALKDVSFEVQHGEVIGILGHNGAGKTTLLRLLSRITDPTEGRAEIRGRIGSLLEVGTGFHPELTGRENIYLSGAVMGMRKAEIDAKFDEIVAFAELERFIDTPVKRYSSGMYVRLGFAIAAHLEPEILMVDEVLAVGDAAFRKKCLRRMGTVAQHGRTVLFVSHSMGALSNLCTRGLVLQQGRLSFVGSIHDAINDYLSRVVADSDASGNKLPHVIFCDERPPEETEDDFAIIKIESLDREGNPKPLVATWDDVTFRVHYRAKKRVNRGSVTIAVKTLDGARLLLLSTEPDGTHPIALEPGVHAVEVAIFRLPLAAGEYLIGAGLAIPNAEWLWLKHELGTFSVAPRDVYGSGLCPSTPRVLVAVQHTWRVTS